MVRKVVGEVEGQLDVLEGRSTAVRTPAADDGTGIFDTMDAAIAAAERAEREYLGCSMADRRRFVQAIRDFVVVPEHLQYMAEEAVRQTGMGDVAHKVVKNRLAATNCPGVEDLVTDAWSGDDGLTTIEYSPFGVIGAITPTTNPTETIICNAIGMLAAGNTVVFSPHPRARDLSVWLISELNKVLTKAGAPRNLLVTVSEPSIENTNAMMAHPAVRMLVATGGPGIVRTVLSSGKKAIGAGAGNPPVVVDRTADIVRAAKDIVDGASFDNNLPCTAEKEVIAEECIADLLKFEMEKVGAFEVQGTETLKKLEELVLNDQRTGPRTEWVGKPAGEILDAIGVKPPYSCRLILVETDKDHPFCQHELMMPVLAVVRVPDVDAAIDLAVEVEHGLRHTAIMHSRDVTKLTKMGRMIQTTIFVKNGPSYAGIGIGGEGYTTFTIAGPTGEGLTCARSFARRRRCAMVGELNMR
ncbi:aldehyde dehydrogenase family protein [Luteococcus sp. H101]